MIAIAAMSKERVIGIDGRIPWHLSADLKFFKRTTLGHVIVMGRKAYASGGARKKSSCRPMAVNFL